MHEICVIKSFFDSFTRTEDIYNIFAKVFFIIILRSWNFISRDYNQFFRVP